MSGTLRPSAVRRWKVQLPRRARSGRRCWHRLLAMRLMIAGGGGFRVPLVYRALCVRALCGAGPRTGAVRRRPRPARRHQRRPRVHRGAASAPARRPAARGPHHHVPADALSGTDLVFAAIRPGGTAGRIADERVAQDLGLLGQETTGAGGISYALRSIPRMLELARQMREHCPDAWLINFTNPAGMVTEALVPVLGRKVIGICDSAGGLVHRAAHAAGVALPEGRLDGVGYYGLNHLGWLYRLESGGRDLLPGPAGRRRRARRLRGRPAVPAAVPRGPGVPAQRIPLLLLRDGTGRRGHAGLAADPRRVHRPAADRSSIRGSPRPDPRPTGCGTPHAAPAKKATSPRPAPAGEHRDETDLAGGGYERVALAVMRALSGGGPAELILNTPNTLPAPPAARAAPSRRFRDCRRTPSSRFPAG